MSDLLQQFKSINTFVFDVDGVLTDGNIMLLPGGIMARQMNTKDGYALQLAIKKKYRILVISGGHSPEVKERLSKLGVTDVFMKVEDKASLLNEYLYQHLVKKEEALFMGDDVPDKKAMQLVGLACCPEDAVQDIKEIAHYISPLPGGRACVRDVIEKTMKLRGDWNEDTSIASI
jgi:3-deoxy-D-manno-octulosonate 8-phosphate phosphatase (KDO 8-P phosphatase)